MREDVGTRLQGATIQRTVAVVVVCREFVGDVLGEITEKDRAVLISLSAMYPHEGQV